MAGRTRTSENYFQTVNFHFQVLFQLGTEAYDMRFQSVTGLDATLETERIREGGENRYEHVVPVRRKYGPLVLKRGLLSPTESGLTTWLKAAFDDERVLPITSLDIALLNHDHKPLLSWTVNNVWPLSWKIGELNAERGEVLIETLELNYNRLLFHD